MNRKDLETDIAATTQVVQRYIRAIRGRLDSLERALYSGSILNPIGELQALGPQLDAAVATLATLKNIRQKLED